jgi:Family of unknown function (DUF5329)
LGDRRQSIDEMRVRRAIPTFLLCVTLLTAGASSWAAGPSTAVRAEIRQLLAFVANSSCHFNRNGTWYPASEASAHLAEKERYLAQRGQIASAEDFITKAATKSSMTGKPYTVRCGSEAAIASDEWLTAELRRLRAGS